MEVRETLIFLHVPKTGGSTLREILARQYHPEATFRAGPHEVQAATAELSRLSAERKAALRLVMVQHAPFGLHTLLAGQCIYVTLLRKPWDRMVSDYYHAGRGRDHSFYKRFQNGASLADFVRYRAYEQGLTNPMTRLVSGLGAFPPFEPLPEDALEVAKHNILEYFSVAGILERFDESLLLMKRRHGWDNVFYRRRNVGRNKPREVVADQNVVQEFRELNSLDYELYSFAKQRLERQVQEAGEPFQRALRWFQFWNRWYQTALGLLREVKKAASL